MRSGEVARPEKSENASKHIGVVILSRFSSRRLPGKALIHIEGKPVLQYIIERLCVVVEREKIVIATSAEKTDDPIAAFAAELNVRCFRGSLDNVADRFLKAARSMHLSYAIRINGDNIFVDTQLLRDMIEVAAKGTFDFVSNVKDRSYPKGMSIEIVKVEYYEEIFGKISGSRVYEEHVTLYLYENEQTHKHFYFRNSELPEAAGIQLALDTPEDLDRTRRMIAMFTRDHTEYNLKEVFALYRKLPVGHH